MRANRCFQVFVAMMISLFLVSSYPLLAAADLKGAASVLQIVAEKSNKNENIEPTKPGKLRADLNDFMAAGAKLPADEAAKQWLSFVDRLFALSPEARSSHEDVERSMGELLVSALPPPHSWEALAKAIKGRPPVKKAGELREAGLRLLIAALTDDKILGGREIQALQSRAENASRSEGFVLRNLFDGFHESQLESTDDPDALLRGLERRLAQSSTERGGARLRLPDLVAIIGEEKASAFLRKALTNANVTIQVNNANATLRLAQKLALELRDQLQSPQWPLANSLDATELFEALDKKFGKSNRKPQGTASFEPSDYLRDYSRGEAEKYYFLGLIGNGRKEDAVTVAQRLGKDGHGSFCGEPLKAMERAGHTKALDDFFFQLLTQDRSLPFWDEYVQAAAKAGRTERMLKLARTAASDEKITGKKLASIHQTLFRALLADDQVEEGVAEIKRLLALDPTVAVGTEVSHGHLGMRLAKLGILTKNQEWTEEGIKAARHSLLNEPEDPSDWSAREIPIAFARLLLDQNRISEAEIILTDALAKAVRKNNRRDEFSSDDPEGARSMLTALATVYHHANRPSDILALFDDAPYWGAMDVSDLLDESWDHDGFSIRMPATSAEEPLPVPYVAAWALAALNRATEARKLNDAALSLYLGFDRGYELLVKLSGSNSVARLDEIFARDRFEERPLIWKARLLADKKELAAAEATVRRAISIDPSDGEQGPGDRMLAYTVLADIREALGDRNESAFFRSVVKAIRLSEEADAYYAAGLLKRAVSMYEKSLQFFADAYCIQSRLAVHLAEIGLHDEAEAHYRRAYELMPDSFGRVESHCFGCERVFEGTRAQSLAEKVFLELTRKQPRKPQVHYLLGYLRTEQGRHTEAVSLFRTAVSLDPDYLNAWQKLLDASEHVAMPAKERTEILSNLLRLDPMRRHVSVDLGHITDLRALWSAAEAAKKVEPARPSSLYVLSASKSAMEKEDNNRGQSHAPLIESRSIGRPMRRTPGAVLAETSLIQIAIRLLDHFEFTEE